MAKIDFIKAARPRRDKEGNLKPNLTCELDKAHEIKPGDSYRKASGRRGGGFYTRVRCAACPTWQPWDLSDSLSNRLAEIVYNYEQAILDVTTVEEFQGALEEAHDAVVEIAEEKRESAENIESGFGHETEQSTELAEIADELDSWADAIDAAKSDIPDMPEPGEDAEDEGEKDSDAPESEDAEDEGEKGDAELTEEQVEAWREEAIGAITVMDESPY
jgi:hypothetical protein